LAVFYRGYRLDHEPIKLADSPAYLEFWSEVWKEVDGSKTSIDHLTTRLLAKEELFGHEFPKIPGLKEQLNIEINAILKEGIEPALRKVLKNHE
jgi:mannitol-1-phosphate/altronate dehydrogenase